jgi:phosphatidylserine/phosphatidylglycerophosphate/cardiolipin synthase-like enzyme
VTKGITPLVALLTVAAGCGTEEGQEVSHTTEHRHVRIVEVLATPAGPAGAFVELRNEGDKARSLRGWILRFGPGRSHRLVGRRLPGAADAGPIDDVPGHGLALVVDAALDDAAALRLACESPMATSRAALGAAHAAANDALAGTLELLEARRCAPLFVLEEGPDLAGALAATKELRLLEGSQTRDTARAPFGQAAAGVAYERVTAAPQGFAPSPIGATPAARNFFSIQDEPSTLRGLYSSAWRMGDRVLELRRKAPEGSDAAVDAEVTALLTGKQLVPNPLTAPFEELVAEAEHRAEGAFYQINDPLIAKAFAQASGGRGAAVTLITDAEFKADAHYRPAHDALRAAGVELKYDESPGGGNRGPLMHDKFLVVDDHTVWTGSYNLIDDEPHRIHADNVLLLHSPALAAVHREEVATMRSGLFGTLKRATGTAGADAFVDGALVDLRFSPGLTDVQRQKRAGELGRSGPQGACNVKSGNGKPILEERFRKLSPCGGPLDLILGELGRATSSIYFVAFAISHDEVADVMLERQAAGVEVRGVVDPTVATKGFAKRLLDEGADVRYTPNGNPECPAYVKPKTKCPKNPNKVWLHHKFLVIDYATDHPVVVTGSHNMSANAEDQNDESLVVVHDRATAELYYRIFRETYDHPQTLGAHRATADLPTVAITEVRPSADPAGLAYVELANLGASAAELGGLVLWNRRESVALPSQSLAPGARALVVVGTGAVPGAAASTPLLRITPSGAPFVSPASALVVRAADGRWVATYDPYTAEDRLPEGVAAPSAEQAREWRGAAAALGLSVELLGKNVTPEAEVPTWSPRGLYSDWGDGFDVTPVGLLLQRAAASAWRPADNIAGTPGYE